MKDKNSKKSPSRRKYGQELIANEYHSCHAAINKDEALNALLKYAEQMSQIDECAEVTVRECIRIIAAISPVNELAIPMDPLNPRPTKPPSEWIRRRDEEPEEDATYLVVLDGELAGQEEPFISTCGYELGEWDEWGVLYWMPMPEPPGKGEGWIGVEDGLPEKDGKYFLATREISMQQDELFVGIGYFDNGEWLGSIVTHWMPLPELPGAFN